MSLNKLNKVKFLNEMEKYRVFTHGKGREIADNAGISYNKYFTYIKGAGANPEIMEQILDATKEFVIERKEAMEEVLN